MTIEQVQVHYSYSIWSQAGQLKWARSNISSKYFVHGLGLDQMGLVQQLLGLGLFLLGQLLEPGKLNVPAHLPLVHLREGDGGLKNWVLPFSDLQWINNGLWRWVLKCGYG